METKAALLKLVDQYQLHFPAERASINAFQLFLSTNNEQQLYDRKNFNGHITASAFILNPTLDSLLLLKHKKLNRWLQPGGHIDATDSSLMVAALRETEEETGLYPQNLAIINCADEKNIFDIDSHVIPANTNKNEPAHVHHDMRLLFKCLQPDLMKVNADEATGFKWIPLVELGNDETFSNVSHKIKGFLEALPATVTTV